MQRLPWLGIEFLYEIPFALQPDFPEVITLEFRRVCRGGSVDGNGRSPDSVIREKVAQNPRFLKRSRFGVGGNLADGEGFELRLGDGAVVNGSVNQLLEGRDGRSQQNSGVGIDVSVLIESAQQFPGPEYHVFPIRFHPGSQGHVLWVKLLQLSSQGPDGFRKMELCQVLGFDDCSLATFGKSLQ